MMDALLLNPPAQFSCGEVLVLSTVQLSQSVTHCVPLALAATQYWQTTEMTVIGCYVTAAMPMCVVSILTRPEGLASLWKATEVKQDVLVSSKKDFTYHPNKYHRGIKLYHMPVYCIVLCALCVPWVFLFFNSVAVNNELHYRRRIREDRFLMASLWTKTGCICLPGA